MNTPSSGGGTKNVLKVARIQKAKQPKHTGKPTSTGLKLRSTSHARSNLALPESEVRKQICNDRHFTIWGGYREVLHLFYTWAVQRHRRIRHCRMERLAPHVHYHRLAVTGSRRGSVWLKLRNGLRSKSDDPDLGPAEPQFAHHCVGCGRVSITQRCPVCQARYLERYNGECWGPTADEAYGVAL